MTNIINLPTFIYPKYSDIYFKQKKAIEEEANTKLKQLSAFQPFYEANVQVFNRFSFDRPVELQTGTTWIIWNINLLSTDKLSMLRPLVEAIAANFPQVDISKVQPNFRTWDTEAFWFFVQRNEDHSVRFSLTINVKYSDEGLADVKVSRIPRVTTSTNYVHTAIEPWWKE